MNEFFHRFFTNPRWFFGTLIVILILVLLTWRAIDPNDFRTSINRLFEDLWAIFWQLFALFIAIIAIPVMFGWNPFSRKRGGH